MVRLKTVFLWASLALATSAAASERTMLVLDGSASMSEEIDGRAKVDIARDSVVEVIGALPATQHVGLMAYGLNTVGDCGDIEELVPLGTDRSGLLDALGGLNPKGETPMADALALAARKLDHREEEATIILVTDGMETCKPRPCAASRRLERRGFDFTVHVIGFDVREPRTIEQLECIAASTGGSYRAANTGDDLSAALAASIPSSVTPTPAPDTPASKADPAAPGTLTLRATELRGGPEVTEGLIWRIRPVGGPAYLHETEATGRVTFDLPEGTYNIFLSRPEFDQTAVARHVRVRSGVARTVSLAVDLGIKATLRTEPSGTAPVNSVLRIHFEGPNRPGDFVALAKAGAATNELESFTRTDRGNPLRLRTPAEPGAYEIRYMLASPRRMLASLPIQLTETGATLTAPDAVTAGASFEVIWTGPGAEGDLITIVPPDSPDTLYRAFAYPRRGRPVQLTADLVPGTYELRYVLAGSRVIARQLIEVDGASASVSGPAEGLAGKEIEIDWTGPAERGDLVTLAEIGAASFRYIDFFYPIRKGEAGTVALPTEPGEYEIRYIQAGRKVLARQPIVVMAAEATLSPPATAEVGETVVVPWSGPATDDDYIALRRPGSNNNIAFFRAQTGGASSLIMPLTAGTYEISYFQGGKERLATVAIDVEDARAAVSGPEIAPAGTEITIDWDGPRRKDDMIVIALPGAPATQALERVRVRGRSEIRLVLPIDAGTYDLRYVLAGQRVLARHAIKVTEATATLHSVSEIEAGTPLFVTWEGPGGPEDVIGFSRPSVANDQLATEAKVAGSPLLSVVAPSLPGIYELRYFLRGTRLIGKKQILVTAREDSTGQ